MGQNREPLDKLDGKPKADPQGPGGFEGEEPVVKAAAVTEPMALPVKGRPGQDDQVDGRGIERGLLDQVAAGFGYTQVAGSRSRSGSVMRTMRRRETAGRVSGAPTVFPARRQARSSGPVATSLRKLQYRQQVVQAANTGWVVSARVIRSLRPIRSAGERSSRRARA